MAKKKKAKEPKRQTEIKRIAQFMWDNALPIAKFLQTSKRFRAVEIEIHSFAPKQTGDLDIKLSIYDEQFTHLYLEGVDIRGEDFKNLCVEMNKKTGVKPARKPIKVRKKL